MPVYVFSPRVDDGPRPAIVVFPGHGTIAQTAGTGASTQANALVLAEAGFVVLTMELRGFGLLSAASHLKIDAAARVVGRTWFGLVVQDGLRAVDYLMTRPDVDTAKIGATGVGAGGGLAMYISALDDRLSAVVVSDYLTKYGLVCYGAEHCACNDIPGILPGAEMGDVAGLIAPRPALYMTSLRIPESQPDAARESYAVAQRVYRTLNVPRQIRLVESADTHGPFDDELATAWFGRWLRQ